jgi:hypothetical protein
MAADGQTRACFLRTHLCLTRWRSRPPAIDADQRRVCEATPEPHAAAGRIRQETSPMSSSLNFWVGPGVHKDSVTAAVFRNADPEPLHVDRIPYDLERIRRYLQRLQCAGSVHAAVPSPPPSALRAEAATPRPMLHTAACLASTLLVRVTPCRLVVGAGSGRPLPQLVRQHASPRG